MAHVTHTCIFWTWNNQIALNCYLQRYSQTTNLWYLVPSNHHLWLDHLLRASSARVAKITTKKTQISILTTNFLIHTSKDSLYYTLFSLNIILCGREWKKEGEREWKKEKERKYEKKKLFVVWIVNMEKSLFTIHINRKNYILPIMLEMKNGS
jgi:hypothetical protein